MLSVYVKKANNEPWTSEDHFILAFDSSSAGGSTTMDIAPGITFQRPVEYAIRYVRAQSPGALLANLD